MYLAITDHTVNVVLLRLDQGVQKPIFYINKTLVEAETHYLPLEKAALSIIHAVRKLPHYFQAYTVVVLTKHPLQALLRRSDFTKRIAKWGTSLGAYDIQYKPCTFFKGQVLAEFVAEFTLGHPKILQVERGKVAELHERIWQVYVDRASNCREARVGIILISLEGIKVEKSLRLGFPASNNEAEYEAFLAGLRMFR